MRRKSCGLYVSAVYVLRILMAGNHIAVRATAEMLQCVVNMAPGAERETREEVDRLKG